MALDTTNSYLGDDGLVHGNVSKEALRRGEFIKSLQSWAKKMNAEMDKLEKELTWSNKTSNRTWNIK